MRGLDGPVAEPEIHLIPAGFVGAVELRHGVDGAGELPRDDDARVYRIPGDGIVTTATRANYGVRPPAAMRFFSVGADGARTPLPRMRDAGEGEVCIIGGWQVRGVFHYVVDRKENAGNWKNPAITSGDRAG